MKCYYSNFKNKKITAKKLLRIVSLVLIIAVTLPTISSATIVNPATGNVPVKTENTRAQQLLLRLDEIKGMDKSEMTRLEKKGLRKEVLGIKKEMKAISGGVYLSVGAIIIIILLLILLL